MLQRFFIFAVCCVATYEACLAQIIEGYTKTRTYKTYYEIYDVVDTALFEVKYAYVCEDPVLKKQKRRHEILLLGRSLNVFKGFGDYVRDSIMNARANEKYTFNEFMEMGRELDVNFTHQIINLEESKIRHVDIIFGTTYYYDEPIPQFDWQLIEGEEEIMGHLCRKATTRWRGRDWTAWYSDIPFPYGPWKFNGLPGLILKIEDATGEQKFKAVESFNREVPIGYDKYEGFRTTRERFNKMLKNHKENAGEMMLKSGMVKMDDKEAARIRKRRLFYAPIELE